MRKISTILKGRKKVILVGLCVVLYGGIALGTFLTIDGAVKVIMWETIGGLFILVACVIGLDHFVEVALEVEG